MHLAATGGAQGPGGVVGMGNARATPHPAPSGHPHPTTAMTCRNGPWSLPRIFAATQIIAGPLTWPLSEFRALVCMHV